MTDITFPDAGASRIHKPELKPSENTDSEDYVSAAERIAAFWRKHKDGSLITSLEVREHGDTTVYTVYAKAYVYGDSVTPASTGIATRSTADPDPIVAARPQEAAETAAISRAIRNLGIKLPKTK